VLRGGVQIGSAPARVRGTLDGGMAYVLRAWDKDGQHWLKLQFSGAGASMDVSAEEKGRFEAPAGFRREVAAAIRPGSVVIVTPESLKAGSTGVEQTVLDNEPG
jgi:hypothetical protein